ncbi:hypothetical protein RvY_11894 [Ramazzottius varieornatus]|uniref:Uncharacterized protein n=1 Tax=Ramazzottius varieornatus TaxID=947166 RepID=A0A1D1VN18_RAMVA|nr:hypothetical protein RvY_11894 [Ramazzottius varieornatus]
MYARRRYKYLMIFLAVLAACFIFLLIWNTTLIQRPEQPWLNYQWTYSRGGDRTSCATASNVPPPGNGLIVHYVRFYPVPNPNQKDHALNVLDCFSIYSVLVNLKPQLIYLHTNVPSFWPFVTCESLLEVTIDWSPVKVLCAPFQFTVSGKRISLIEHEADIRKFKAVEEHGGLVLDFDVYIIDGTLVRNLMRTNPCIICHEGSNGKVNAGFFGCRKPHSAYPRLVLQESYEKNYNPICWVCNSGIIPMTLLEKHADTAVIADNVCTAPNFWQKEDFNSRRDRYNWTSKPAYHSYFHNSRFSLKDARNLESSLGDVFRWILKGGPPELMGKQN